MDILVCIAQKGGVGKTTLACSLATAAVETGKDVCMLDLDPQQSVAKWGQIRELNGRTEPYIRAIGRRALPAALRAAADSGYHLVIIDTPPHTEMSVLSAGVLADLILVPTKPALHDGLAIATTIDVCREAKVRAPIHVVINQARTRGTLTSQFVSQWQGRGVDIAPQRIILRIDHEYAAMQGLTAQEYNTKGKAADEIRALYRWTVQQLDQCRLRAA